MTVAPSHCPLLVGAVSPDAASPRSVRSQIVIERATRNKRKCVTTIRGLDLYGYKLAESAKKFGKKFACGSSVVKDATGKEEIDVQARRQPHCPPAQMLAPAQRFTVVGLIGCPTACPQTSDRPGSVSPALCRGTSWMS